MSEPHTNLTAAQKDYAIFLPALSTFYALFVGRQRRGLIEGTPYIDAGRIPANMPHGVAYSPQLLTALGIRYPWSPQTASSSPLHPSHCKAIPASQKIADLHASC